MKAYLEEIKPDRDSSFRLLLTPHLNDFFMWHFHPEFELVFIEGADGPRHVGDHLSRYEGSDLVFIGSYVPHLNFDYGVRTDYRKVVVQMREDFLRDNFQKMPELAAIARLFDQARWGVAFYGNTKRLVGKRLARLHGRSHFRQLIELLEIFQLLATSSESVLLNNRPVGFPYNQKEQQRLQRVYRFIDANYQRKIEMAELADVTNLTVAAFCRYFRKMTRMTFTEFVNQYRIREAKRLLLADQSVTEVCFASGFESLSYFNRVFKKVTGVNPMGFKKVHG
ncbi:MULTISPECIES: AraC family transcriptional regulator [Larkinella]|uniref:Helix-turn-helix transcriptional regulator n=1 Tax=Larkinella humicola TaxID=2607654 RepID=A0A5N1JC22_9BACT|nr:AraC family transcriptional regulator [Larkinella humicola]KAA9346669.1 helix-turn-helix transcriptional regulator [Larkinella humicola]